MSIKENSKIEKIKGEEGTDIKQYFNPHNTLNGINYSLAQFTLESGKKTKLHRIKSSEIYYILQGKAELKINDGWFVLGEIKIYVFYVSLNLHGNQKTMNF